MLLASFFCDFLSFVVTKILHVHWFCPAPPLKMNLPVSAGGLYTVALVSFQSQCSHPLPVPCCKHVGSQCFIVPPASSLPPRGLPPAASNTAMTGARWHNQPPTELRCSQVPPAAPRATAGCHPSLLCITIRWWWPETSAVASRHNLSKETVKNCQEETSHIFF